MLKTFKRVSGNKDKIYDNLEKKNHVVSKFDRIIEENVLKNILKVPAEGRLIRGWGGLFPVFLKYLKNYKS